MELHGEIGLERWAQRMQLDRERFEQRVAQMVEVEKRRVEEELEHFTAAGREQAKGCAALRPELLVNVFEVLQEVVVWRRSEPKEDGLAFSKAVAVVREVCAGWQAVHIHPLR